MKVALHRVSPGDCRPTPILLKNGHLADRHGEILKPTKLTGRLIGWGKMDGIARIWKTEAGAEYLIPENWE